MRVSDPLGQFQGFLHHELNSCMKEPCIVILIKKFRSFNGPENFVMAKPNKKFCNFFQQWDEDNGMKLILIKGTGGKAFCAGGDVRGNARKTLFCNLLLYWIYRA